MSDLRWTVIRSSEDNRLVARAVAGQRRLLVREREPGTFTWESAEPAADTPRAHGTAASLTDAMTAAETAA